MFKQFTIGHFILIFATIAYTFALCFFLKKRKLRTQVTVLGVLALIGVSLFAYRWRILFQMWFGDRVISAPEYGGLLPLELCNIGVFVLPFTVFFRKRFLCVFSFYVNLLGAMLALLILPNNIQQLTPLKWQFWDYMILHANLVAIPFTIVTCGWYKLQMKDTLFATVLFMCMFGILFFINLFLEAINWVGDHNNYLFVMGPKGFPIISQLWSIIPVPFIYILPLAPVFWGYCMLVVLPFIKRDQFKQQWGELVKSLKFWKNLPFLKSNDQPSTTEE